MAEVSTSKKRQTSDATGTVCFTMRLPVELYHRIPVAPARSSGKRDAGIAGYLRPMLIEAIERDLAAKAQGA